MLRLGYAGGLSVGAIALGLSVMARICWVVKCCG